MKTNQYLFIFFLISFMGCKSNKQSSSSEKANTLKALSTNKTSIYIEDKTFDDILDFTSFSNKILIGKALYNTSITYDITFVNCTFNKPVLAYKATNGNAHNITSFWGHINFIECRFKDIVSFRASKFMGQCNFTKSEFFGRTNFEESSFNLNTFFNWSTFDKDVRFQNSFFNQKANFMNTTFSENVSFQSSIFNSDAQFSSSKYYNYADFSLTQHRGSTFYNFSEFYGSLDISHSVFLNSFSMNYSGHKKTSINNSRFMGKTNFTDIKVKKNLNLEGCFFLFDKPKNENFITQLN